MKKQRMEEKKSAVKITKIEKGQRVWKIVAVAVVIIFVLIVLGVSIKIYHYKSALTKPTQSQIDYATKIAEKKLQSTGNNASAFQIHVGSRIKTFSNDGASRSIIQVSFMNNSASHTYLIDLNSGEVLLHTETDAYGAWSSHNMYNRHDSMLNYMRDKK